MYQRTTATKKLERLTKRIRGVAGGTAASKTISIILILINHAQSHDNVLISVVSETFPHLKRGAIRDFLNIMETHHYFNPGRWNKTDYTYEFETGSKIEFFSADQPSKVRGPRRHILFINEANNILYETFTQLEIRTSDIIWIDWNPVAEFWFYDEILGKRDDVDFLTLTYKDNEACPIEVVKAIEARRFNKQWFRVYGEGQLGEIEGRVYTGWKFIDEVPHEARLEKYGLDFGYSVDPTGIVACYHYNDGVILDEIVYQKGLSNKQIADIFLGLPQAIVRADAAEPKSIDEIRSYGVMILPSNKGPDSIRNGIQYIQGLRVSATKRSLNLIKEYRNYMWQQDNNGRFIQKPIGIFNHLLDAVRYAYDDRITHNLADKLVDQLPKVNIFDEQGYY